MDAPLCRICHTKHYGTEAHKFGSTEKSEQPARKKKSKKIKIPVGFYGAGGGPTGPALFERVEVLEALVAELIESKKKRSIYMKNYMRDRRAEGRK
jgi:hypothetical protein